MNHLRASALSLVLLAGCVPAPAPPEPAAVPVRNPAAEKYEAIRAAGLDPSLDYPYWPLVYTVPRWTSDAAVRALEGEIRHYGADPFGPVTVRFTLVDSQGRICGEAFDMARRIGPGERWAYRAVVWDDRAVKAKSIEVDCPGLPGF